MKLHELKATPGSRKKETRIGRGTGSGKGKTATRGHKGQNSRSGGGTRPGFEGGQTPLFRRIPKIGFNSHNQKEYVLINLDQIEKFAFDEINHQTLVEHKIIKNDKVLVKILAKGTLTKKVKVKVNKVSQSSKAMIEKNGGTVEVI